MNQQFFLSLDYLHPTCALRIITSGKLPKNSEIWELNNEIKPVDLYCYLYAKYGRPNGIQNFLRENGSDNLIHWDWTFGSPHGLVTILGLNFRTEIQLLGDFRDKGLTKDQFIEQIKSDIGNYGRQISELRKSTLEKWAEFINPFNRLRSSIEQCLSQIEELGISPLSDKEKNVFDNLKVEEIKNLFNKYSLAMGLAFGVRSMMPVLAESFINLIIFLLAKKEIKANDRLFKNCVSQQIDVRVQTLHLNCDYFEKPIDSKDEIFKDFHTLFNERNDLLHGNIEIQKLKYGEVYFNGTVPIFDKYESMWEKSLGMSLKSVGFEKVTYEYGVVNKFIEFVLSHIKSSVRAEVEQIMETRDLGFNPVTNRVGILFPDYIVDMRPVYKPEPA